MGQHGGFDILEWFKDRQQQGVNFASTISHLGSFGQEITPYGEPPPPSIRFNTGDRSNGFTQDQFLGSRNTGAGYNGPGSNRGFHRGNASDSYANVQGNIARARFNELKSGLDQLRKAQAAGGGGGASGIINARIGRAKDELAEGNAAFDTFFEDIAPGFEEALDSAKSIALAEAAIEGHFEGTQEAIDERYATAEGGVLAIADSLGPNSESLQDTLRTSVNEFKEFIDEDLHLEKNQAQALNAAASSLAAAAAEAASAQARGAGARDQFTFQKRYEKIIQNLLDQRAAASSARGNAIRGAAEQLLANYRASQPFTREQMGNFVMFDMVNQIVPPAQQNLAYGAITAMRQAGITNWNDWRDASLVLNQAGALVWESELDRQTWEALAPYANVIESAVNPSTQNRIDELYNQSFQDPQTTFDRFNVSRGEGFDAGFNFQDATNYANQQLLTDGDAFQDLGSILDKLEADGYGDLFGRGLGG